jgi:hypothetical protein
MGGNGLTVLCTYTGCPEGGVGDRGRRNETKRKRLLDSTLAEWSRKCKNHHITLSLL